MRLALPLLSSLQPDTHVDFALIRRDGSLARDGRATLAQLGALARAWPAYAVLQESDAIVARVAVPPVPAKRLRPAVLATIESMALSDADELVVGHGPQAADGSVTVAWSTRGALQRAWSTMAGAGLSVTEFVPRQIMRPGQSPRGAAPAADAPRAGDSIDWLAPLPEWGLRDDALKPAAALGRWRRAMAWTAAAAAVWVLGLNAYALQRGAQVKALQQSMRDTVAHAFPKIPVIIDPLRQAQQQRDALSHSQGLAATDDFMPLALAAARVLDFAQSHVRALRYDKGVLTLTLADGYVPPANEAALAQAAAVQRVLLEKDAGQPHVWHARRPEPAGMQDTRTIDAHRGGPGRGAQAGRHTRAGLP